MADGSRVPRRTLLLSAVETYDEIRNPCDSIFDPGVLDVSSKGRGERRVIDNFMDKSRKSSDSFFVKSDPPLFQKFHVPLFLSPEVIADDRTFPAIRTCMNIDAPHFVMTMSEIFSSS